MAIDEEGVRGRIRQNRSEYSAGVDVCIVKCSSALVWRNAAARTRPTSRPHRHCNWGRLGVLCVC